MSKVKICGLRRREDIEAVNQSLPDFIGFVFAESKRKVDAETAADLKNRLNPEIKAVGVFVNQEISLITALHQRGIIDMIQLHGEENADYMRELKESCNCPIIKSVGIGDFLPALPVEADYLLFDTASAVRGGTGRTFNWNLIKDCSQTPYFLAGGLTLDNVVHGIQMLSPFCVDVSSAVETNGMKDPEKIKSFVHLIRRIS